MDRLVLFSTNWVASLPASARCEYRDTQVAGLVLRVGRSSKVFCLYKRVRLKGRSVERKVRLGSFPAMSLAAARRLATKLASEAYAKKARGSIDLSPEPVRANEELLTTEEAAHLTKMSRAWFERMRWEGQGPPYYRAGRAVRYMRSELLGWWKERKGL